MLLFLRVRPARQDIPDSTGGQLHIDFECEAECSHCQSGGSRHKAQLHFWTARRFCPSSRRIVPNQCRRELASVPATGCRRERSKSPRPNALTLTIPIGTFTKEPSITSVMRLYDG